MDKSSGENPVAPVRTHCTTISSGRSLVQCKRDLLCRHSCVWVSKTATLPTGMHAGIRPAGTTSPMISSPKQLTQGPGSALRSIVVAIGLYLPPAVVGSLVCHNGHDTFYPHLPWFTTLLECKTKHHQSDKVGDHDRIRHDDRPCAYTSGIIFVLPARHQR